MKLYNKIKKEIFTKKLFNLKKKIFNIQKEIFIKKYWSWRVKKIPLIKKINLLE